MATGHHTLSCPRPCQDYRPLRRASGSHLRRSKLQCHSGETAPDASVILDHLEPNTKISHRARILIASYFTYCMQKRIKNKISIGDGGLPDLAMAVRAAGNFNDYVPLFLILSSLAELTGAVPPLALHAMVRTKLDTLLNFNHDARYNELFSFFLSPSVSLPGCCCRGWKVFPCIRVFNRARSEIRPPPGGNDNNPGANHDPCDCSSSPCTYNVRVNVFYL